VADRAGDAIDRWRRGSVGRERQKPDGVRLKLGWRAGWRATHPGRARSSSRQRTSNISEHPVLRQLECTPQRA